MLIFCCRLISSQKSVLLDQLCLSLQGVSENIATDVVVVAVAVNCNRENLFITSQTICFSCDSESTHSFMSYTLCFLLHSVDSMDCFAYVFVLLKIEATTFFHYSIDVEHGLH